MKFRYILKYIIAALLLNLFFSNVVSSFSDLDPNSVDYFAVNFLRENGVVNGYEDGSFGPDRLINRAELTKILVESNKVILNIDNELQPCFPDVAVDEWYSKYVCTAKQLGWIEGYADGTFKPSSFVNRAEALKIVTKAQSWPEIQYANLFPDVTEDEWFAPYLTYPRSKNYLPYLEEFEASEYVTRIDFAQVYFRYLYSKQAGWEFFDPTKSLTNNPIEVNPKDITSNFETYPSNYFKGIIFNSNFYKKFYVGEVYNFEGVVENPNQTKVLLDYSVKGKFKRTVTANVKNGKFSVPIYFSEPGEYSVVIVPGLSGSAKPAIIDVDEVPSFDAGQKRYVGNIETQILYFEDLLRLRFDDVKDIYKIVVTQPGNTAEVEYYTRDNSGELVFKYADFKDFSPGTVKVSLFGAEFIGPNSNWSKLELLATLEFKAVNHFRSEFSSKLFLSENWSYFFEPRKPILIEGLATTVIQDNLYLILPNGKTDKLNSEFAKIPSRQIFEYRYVPKIEAPYIFSIVDSEGITILNAPKYPIGYFPLIPDYFDLIDFSLSSDKIVKSESEAKKMLSLINTERRRRGLNPLINDTKLEAMALSHSEDMVANDYFSHTDSNSQGSSVRKGNFGIETPVAENIAKSLNTEFAHFSLLRSATHRENILSPYWNRIGIGVKQDREGFVFVTQEFSADRNKLINSVRSEFKSRFRDLDENKVLQSRSEFWAEKMLEEGFFATSIEDESIFDEIDATADVSRVKALVVSGSKVESVIELIEKSYSQETENWTDYGLGVMIDQDGVIKVALIWGN